MQRSHPANIKPDAYFYVSKDSVSVMLGVSVEMSHSGNHNFILLHHIEKSIGKALHEAAPGLLTNSGPRLRHEL